MRALKAIGTFTLLFIVALLLFMGGSAVLGPSVSADALTADEQQQAGLAMLVMVAIDVLVMSGVILSSQLRGWRLVIWTWITFYGVKTFSSMLEATYFMKNLTPSMLPHLFAMTLPLTLGWSPLAVWWWGRWKGPSAKLVGPTLRQAVAVLIAGAVVYPVLFFLFGYFVAYRVPEVREFYGDSGATTFFAHLGLLFSNDPKLLVFEMFRGVLWVALLWAVLTRTRGPWWEGTLLAMVVHAVVQNDVHLLPNPLMSAVIRQAHLLETVPSNALFMGLTGLLLALAVHRPTRHQVIEHGLAA